MNVLFVTTTDLSGQSGDNIATRELIEAFSTHDEVNLSLISPTSKRNLSSTINDVNVPWTLPKKSDGVAWHVLSQPSWVAGFTAALKKENPDIVVARAAPSLLIPPVLSRLAEIPYFLLVRGMVSRNLKFKPLINAVVGLNVRLADEVFVAYKAIADAIDSYRRSDQSELTVVPNAVDPERFSPKDCSMARSKIGLEVKEEFVIGFAGSLQERHCVSELIRAVAAVRDEVPLHLLIIGDGPQRQSLEILANDLGVSDLVTFTGYVDHDVVSMYYAACDVLYGVVDPDQPSNPIKCYEYLACERPIITTQTPEFEFVEEESVGLLVDDVEVKQIGNCIRKLYRKDSGDRIHMGKRGRKYVVENHTWTKVVERILHSV